MWIVLPLSFNILSFVFSKTEYSIADDWPYSDNVEDACFPDPCNGQGLCDYTDEGIGYYCTCISAFTGETCDTLKDDCDEDFCQNGGTCYWIFDEQACFCDTGYTGDSCETYSEEFDDVCLNIVCGTDEQGYCEDLGDGEGTCTCYDGWTGDYCTSPITYCTATQYMDLVSQLLILKPQYQSDCVYMTTQVWAMVPVTNTIPALCDCIYAMQTYIPYEFNNLECVIDHSMTLTRAVEDYCPIEVTQDDIDTMLLSIAEQDDNCHHFVYNRATMPLYRQEEFKCACLLGLAESYDEALEIFNVPFAMHTASSGAIAWQNCYEETVCDFSAMYDKLKNEMLQVDPMSAEWCLTTVTKISGEQPENLDTKVLADYMCPCLSAIESKWAEGIETFDCKHVSYSETTMKEMMQLVCQNTEFRSTSCTYTFTEYVFQLSTYDFPSAANCLSAMKLGDQITSTNGNFDEVFCGCYSSVSVVDGFDAEYIDSCAEEIGWIVPSPQSYCEAYLGTSGSTMQKKVDGLEILDAASTSDSTESTFWMVLGFVCMCLLVPMIGLNIWLFISIKSTGYVAQEDDLYSAPAANNKTNSN